MALGIIEVHLLFLFFQIMFCSLDLYFTFLAA